MVPKGWEKRDLHGLITIKHGFAFKSEYFSNDGKYVLLTPGSFNESGGFRNQGPKTKFYNGPIPNGYLLSKGDLLLAMTEQAEGLLGSPLFVPEDNKYLHNQRLGLVEINCPDKICSDFLYLFFNHEDSRKQITEQSTGTKVKHTSPDRLSSVIGLVPSFLEQKKIAQILSTWDKAISVMENLLANSQQQKKALMQQLLTGKKRLLDENEMRFSGKWKRVKLGAIADMNSGGTPKSTVEEYYGGDIPWVSISDMTSNGKWIATTEKYLTELGLTSSSARIYPKNSVLYAMYASIGECSIAAVNLTSSQAILGIRPKDCLNYEFLYFYLASLKEKIKLQGQQGTQSNLNAGMVKEFELNLPSIKEQQKIAAVLSAADAEISILEKKLACLKDEKKALMQQLLTGKRRVSVPVNVEEQEAVSA